MKRLIYLIFLALVISGCGGGTTTGQSADEVKNPPVEDPADEDTAETPPDEEPPDETPPDETPPDTETCDDVVNNNIKMDDENPCTDDLCDPVLGIVHNGNSITLGSCEVPQANDCPALKGLDVCDPDTKKSKCNPIEEPFVNECGGCKPLANKLGDKCPGCGYYQCDGLDSLKCYYDDGGGSKVVGTSCSVETGPCKADGVFICVWDNPASTKCNANPLPPSNEVCDGIDNDCNGAVDDNISPIPSTCGIGECVSIGQKTCAGGKIVDSCQPKPATDEICDGKDNDCDGNIEESKNCGCLGAVDTYLEYPTLNDFPYDAASDKEYVFSSPGREPSGTVYIPTYDSIFMVGDGGHIVRLSTDLAVLNDWPSIGGDMEGITYDPNTNKIYVIIEGSQLVKEYTYTPSTGALTFGRSWDVSSIIPYYNDGSGIEAVTFVPTTNSAQGGVFYIGNQHDGKIYIIEIDLLGNDPAYEYRLFPNAPQNINIVDPPPGITRDVSDLYYEPASELVYAIWDQHDRMGALDTKTNSYAIFFELPSAQVPGSSENEEGITFDDACRLFIGQDVVSGQVYGSMKRFDP